MSEYVDIANANSAFNAQQAQLNRDFQAYMSNTAHQREVADLKAAGLSPILSANSGAVVPSGSAATADTSANSALAAVAAASIAAQANLQINQTNNAYSLLREFVSNPFAASAAAIGNAGIFESGSVSASAAKALEKVLERIK